MPESQPTEVLTKQEMTAQPNNTLPGAEREGSLRTSFKGLTAGTFKTNLVVMPAGQCSPPRASEIEHIIYVLEGSFEFLVDGAPHLLAELDQIRVPVGVLWEYRNAALAQSVFLSITGP